MARSEMFIDVTPEAVFDLLSDPAAYGDWIVGSRKVHTADQDWPVPGAEFGHSVGIGPLSLRDRTTVVSARAPTWLELVARARPLPSARVRFRLEAEGAGTRVIMTEKPANRLLSLVLGPVGHWAVALRNMESLRRLKRLAEGARPLAPRQLPGPLPDG